MAFAAQAFAQQNIAPLSNNPTRQGAVGQAEKLPPGENQGVYSDPVCGELLFLKQNQQFATDTYPVSPKPAFT
ncbi:MAG: hypothetical protein ACLQDV_22915 [Candidatus Binataceae bacterium]